MRILIAEDDPIARRVLCHIVRQSGHEVIEAGDGAQALDLLHQHNCRACISDWEMPHFSGIELCRAIRDEHASAYTYVILVTSHDSPEQKIEGLKAGADDFMSKPINPAELTVRLHTAERIVSLETRDVTIFALAKLAESRDPETGSHIERVQAYACELARHCSGIAPYSAQIGPKYVSLIRDTSPLHDIGKVGIPDSVLLKPGRLSDREFDVMKTHTLIGSQTLDAALERYPGTEFLLMARDIALSHHERWDGTGYPRGLSGEQIPLSARLVALADVYDALTTKRVYKDAFSHDIARAIIVKERATQFDPGLVDAFLAIEERFIAIRQKLQDPMPLAA